MSNQESPRGQYDPSIARRLIESAFPPSRVIKPEKISVTNQLKKRGFRMVKGGWHTENDIVESSIPVPGNRLSTQATLSLQLEILLYYATASQVIFNKVFRKR